MKFFNLEITRRKASDPYRRSGSFVSRWARPPSKNTAEWLDMFSKSPRLEVVERIASDLANLSGHLLRINPDGSEVEVKEHPFLDLLERPNPLYEMTSSAMWRLNEIYLMLVGESFMLVERDEHELPVELWNVPPHWVKMTPYLGNPGYLITSPSGLTMTVSVDDMFVMKQLNPLDPYMRGLGVAESIADEIEIDEYAAKFQKRFFYNDATPPFVFLIPGASKEQLDVFTSAWEQRHRGVGKSHRMSALGGNVTIEKLGDAHGKEMGFLESRLAIRDAALEHFGVPREIMGITENSNRATADAAQYIYAKNVLTPRISNREQAINMQLLSMFGDDRLVWRFDPVIPYDKEFDKQKALDGWNAGLLTKNEARGMLDLPNVSGGDVYKVSINDMFEKQTEESSEVSQVSTTGRGMKSERRINVEAMLRREDTAIKENARRFEAVITRHFSEQCSAMMKSLGMTRKSVGTDALAALDNYLLSDGTFDPEKWAALTEIEQQELTKAVATGLLNWREEAKKLTALFTPLWKQAYDDGAKVAAESYGLTGLDRPEFVSQAKVNGGKRVVGIQETTQKKIAEIISNGVENGVGQRTLRQEILQAMGPGTTRTRAKLIAQQETSMSLATGQFETMKAAGAKEKTWHHRDNQDNPRDGTHGKVNHVKLEGETVGIDEKFSNGLRYPRDPEDGRPEEVIRCRCYLTYSFEDVPRHELTLTSEDGIMDIGTGQGIADTHDDGQDDEQLDLFTMPVQGVDGSDAPRPGKIEQTGTVDFSDKPAVLGQLRQAKSDFAGLEHEMNCTVTSDGKVWRVSGTRGKVNPWGIEALGSSLKGSYSYHNHPPKQTWYSFSAADVRFFFAAEETYAMASDDAYEYTMQRTKDTLDIDPETAYYRFEEIEKTDVFDLKWNGAIDLDIDGYHTVMEILSRELNFTYERKKKA